MKNVIKNFLLGFIAFFIAFLLAVLVTDDKLGMRVDKSLLSDEAVSILNETPNEPLTQNQLKRFNRAAEKSTAYLSNSKYLLKELSSSWYWFILIPGLFLFCKFLYKKSLHWFDSILITFPSLILLGILFINL